MERTIEAAAALETDWETARDRFLSDPSFFFDETDTVELVVDLGDGLTLHQEVALHIGTPRHAEGEVWLPVRWVAVGRQRVLPSFEGVLELRHDELCGDDARIQLLGTYTVPFGFLGRFGDGVRGRRIARRSLESLAAELAERFDRRVAQRATGLPGPVYAEVLRDRMPRP
jgi:hypothetical protein